MKTVDIHDAEAQLAQLVTEAANGEGFIITDKGKPIAQVTGLKSPAPSKQRRLGFLAGQITVPEDFDQIDEYHHSFTGNSS